MPGRRTGADRSRLTELTKKIRVCRHCLEAPDREPLPHEPRPVLRVSSTARICVCGQAPGTLVHASGKPFTDPSGKRLRDWMGVSEDEFYDRSRISIVPMGFCFPGQDEKGADLPPRRECAAIWHEQLFAALPQFELILAVGAYAQRWHLARQNLPCPPSVAQTVAQWRDYGWRNDAPCVILPLPHPSWRNNGWIRRHPWFAEELLPELRRQVRQILSSDGPAGAAE